MISLIILASLISVTVPQYVNEQFQTKKFIHTPSNGEKLSGISFQVNYRLLTPDPIRKGEVYPLIVWLNGPTTQSKNKSQLQYVHETFLRRLKSADCPYFIYAPKMNDFLVKQDAGDSAADSKQESNSASLSSEFTPNTADFLNASILQFIKENPVDPDRVYLIGVGEAGRVAWNCLTEQPSHFAALMNFNSGIDFPEDSQTILNTPVWFFYSASDKRTHVESGIKVVEQLTNQGGIAALNYAASDLQDGNVTFSSSIGTAFEQYELLDWLMAQSRTTSTAPPPGVDLLTQILQWQYWKARAPTWAPVLLILLIGWAWYRERSRRTNPQQTTEKPREEQDIHTM